jgi:hypothetical protein
MEMQSDSQAAQVRAGRKSGQAMEAGTEGKTGSQERQSSRQGKCGRELGSARQAARARRNISGQGRKARQTGRAWKGRRPDKVGEQGKATTQVGRTKQGG